MGPALTLWSIRFALICYALALAALLVDARRFGSAARILWTVGVGLFVFHVLCAFNVYHDWSHAHAYQHTAEVTERYTGWKVGVGIYFNYVFLIVWLGDALAWWLWPASYPRRTRVFTLAIHLFLFFMAFNGAVVFAAGPTRWWGVALSLLLVLLLARRGYGKKKELLEPSAAAVPPLSADQDQPPKT